MKDTFVPLARPSLAPNASRYLQECLDTGWLSSAGPFVPRFEKEVARFLDAEDPPFTIATNTGTAALHLALVALGVRPDEEVILTPLIFVASANAIRYVGAHPVFVDVDTETGQLSPREVDRFLETGCRRDGRALINRATGRRVSAIVLAHAFGHPCDVAPLTTLARRHALRIVEDAAESFGATYRGVNTGLFGDIACLSFNGNKVMSTGGGGMLVTRDETLARRALSLATNAKEPGEEFLFREVAFNYRLSNLQAALGCAQLETFGESLTKKRAGWRRYRELFSGVPGVRLLEEAPFAQSNQWMTTLLAPDAPGLRRWLKEHAIASSPLWVPLDRIPAHAASFSFGCPNAWELYRRGLWIPSSVEISDEELARVADSVRAWAERASASRSL